MESISHVFKRLDTNSDGRVSRAELVKGIKQVMRNGLQSSGTRAGIDEAIILRMLRHADVDGNGNLDYHEFEKALKKVVRETRKDVARRLPMTDGAATPTTPTTPATPKSGKRTSAGGRAGSNGKGFVQGFQEALGAKTFGYA